MKNIFFMRKALHARYSLSKLAKSWRSMPKQNKRSSKDDYADAGIVSEGSKGD